MRRIAVVIFIMILACVVADAQSYIRRGKDVYSTPLYNWDGVELRGGRGKYAKVLFSWDGKCIRQGDSRYSTALYNSDGQYIRKGEDKYSQPLMNISGPVPPAVLIYILLL